MEVIIFGLKSFTSSQFMHMKKVKKVVAAIYDLKSPSS